MDYGESLIQFEGKPAGIGTALRPANEAIDALLAENGMADATVYGGGLYI